MSRIWTLDIGLNDIHYYICNTDFTGATLVLLGNFRSLFHFIFAFLSLPQYYKWLLLVTNMATGLTKCVINLRLTNLDDQLLSLSSLLLVISLFPSSSSSLSSSLSTFRSWIRKYTLNHFVFRRSIWLFRHLMHSPLCGQ